MDSLFWKCPSTHKRTSEKKREHSQRSACRHQMRVTFVQVFVCFHETPSISRFRKEVLPHIFSFFCLVTNFSQGAQIEEFLMLNVCTHKTLKSTFFLGQFNYDSLLKFLLIECMNTTYHHLYSYLNHSKSKLFANQGFVFQQEICKKLVTEITIWKFMETHILCRGKSVQNSQPMTSEVRMLGCIISPFCQPNLM